MGEQGAVRCWWAEIIREKTEKFPTHYEHLFRRTPVFRLTPPQMGTAEELSCGRMTGQNFMERQRSMVFLTGALLKYLESNF